MEQLSRLHRKHLELVDADHGVCTMHVTFPCLPHINQKSNNICSGLGSAGDETTCRDMFRQ